MWFGKSALFLSAMLYTAALCVFGVNVIILRQQPPHETASSEIALVASHLETRVADMLEEYRTTERERRWQAKARQSKLSSRFSELKTVEVSSTSRGYWLLEPKLMIAVDHLGGGDLRAKFSDRYERVRVGQRMDVHVDDQACFLIMVESIKGKALFQFGCELSADEKLAANDIQG